MNYIFVSERIDFVHIILFSFIVILILWKFKTPICFFIRTVFIKIIRGKKSKFKTGNILRRTNEENLINYFRLKYLDDYNHIFTRLSCIQEEEKDCDCTIVFVDDDIEIFSGLRLDDEDDKISFKNDTENISQIRSKWAEMCNKQPKLSGVHSVIVNKTNHEVIGFGLVSNNNEKIVVKIRKEYWEYTNPEGAAIIYNKGTVYSNIRDNIKKKNKETFENKIKELFESYNENDFNFKKCLKIYSSAIEAGHGTTLIFTDDDDVHTELHKGYKVKSFYSDKDKEVSYFIKGITSPDGAVVFNAKGDCIKIAVTVPNDNDPNYKKFIGKGERYNSAMNFISYQKKKQKNYLAIIISQDKNVYIESSLDFENKVTPEL